MKKTIITSLKVLFISLVGVVLYPLMVMAEDNTCPPFQEYVSKGTGSEFLLNKTFEILLDAAANVTEASWNTFAVPLQAVVTLGSAIYIAVYTLKNLGSFSQQDFSGYLSNEKSGVLPLMVKVAAVLILLTDDGKAFMYGSFISPVVSSCMYVGSKLGGVGIGGSFSDANDVRGLFNGVLTKIQDFNDMTYEVVALGQELLCLAFMPDSFFDTFWSLVPFGLVLYFMGWLICIGLAFYMLDVLFRLAVGCIILPFAIACAVSKLTSTYCLQTWKLFVNVCFNFMVIGVVTKFAVDMIATAIARQGDLKSKLTGSAVLQESDVEDIVKNIDVYTFVCVFLCCMIIFRLFTEIEQLAERVSGAGPVGQLSQKASTPFIRGAMAGGKKLGGGLVTRGAQAVKYSAPGTFVRKGYQNMKNKAKNLLNIP